MTDLIERIEGAEGASRELFESAFYQCFPEPDWGPWWRLKFTDEEALWDRRFQRFMKLVSLGAWLSAAEMLVPEGSGWAAHSTVNGKAIACVGKEDATTAPTPALALVAACLKARG